MSLGIERRFKRIFSSADQRALCIACDHGLMTDPQKSWLKISTVVRGTVREKADGLLLSTGQANRFVKQYGRGILPAFIIRTDWTNLLRLRNGTADAGQLLPVDQFEYRRLLSAQEALYGYGACAAIGFLFVDPGGKFESVTVKASRELIAECHEIGLPCIIEVLTLRSSDDQADPTELLRSGIQTAITLGADALKIPLTDQITQFASLIHQAEKRLFVLGGSSIANEDLFIDLMSKALAAGADGLLVGRNVSKSNDPGRLIARLRAAVHPS
jgi:DhnA family fructose-bisphosphate aldolase class Ia